MANETGMTLQVSPELVRPVIEQKIQAAIVAELEKSNESSMISAIVGRVLSQQVDSDGKQSHYTHRDSPTYIQWLCEHAIREASKKAIKEWVDKNSAKIEAHMQAELTKRSKGMAKVFMDGIIKSMESTWSFKVDVGFETKER